MLGVILRSRVLYRNIVVSHEEVDDTHTHDTLIVNVAHQNNLAPISNLILYGGPYGIASALAMIN